ncbi:hypothetical protein, partial [Alistipes putredinis]|uniref:hypothetical protein n=1 Tax=Alistipes putredinis TaxID=28117 RepID=UPI003AF9FA82
EQGFLYLGEDGLNFTGGEQTVKEFWHAQYPEKAKLSRAAGYRIIMFQDLLFRYIRPGDGKNAACGLKIIFFGGGFFVGTNI